MKKSTIWLIDIDGTVCEDIPNEQAYRFREAKMLPGSLKKVQELYSQGDRVTFFTSRTVNHSVDTEYWLMQRTGGCCVLVHASWCMHPLAAFSHAPKH